MSEENDIYIALQEFIVNFTDAPTDHVLQGWPNRASTPPDSDFIYMSVLSQARQSTNIKEINVAGDEETIYQPVRLPIQVDCFGAKSLEWATIISTLLRDSTGITFLESSGVTPLFSEDAQNLSGIALGDMQNASRWMVTAELQRIASVALTTQTMIEAEVETIEVYSEYPA